MRGHLREGRARIESVLALPGVEDHPEAKRLALEAAGGIAYWGADMATAMRFYDEALVLTRATGDKKALANALYNDSFPRVVGRTDMRAALPILEEAATLYGELGDTAGLARCEWAIGNVHYFLEDYPHAIPALEEAIGHFRRLGDNFSLGWALHTRALVGVNTGDAATADPLVAEGLKLFSDAGDVSGVTLLLDDSAQLAQLKGERMRALRLAGASRALQARSGTDLAAITNATGSKPVPAPNQQEEAGAWEEGRAMSSEAAVAYALEPDIPSPQRGDGA